MAKRKPVLKPKPPNILQMMADAKNRKLQVSPTGPAGLDWFFEFHFKDSFNQLPEWYRDPAHLNLLLERVAALPWFPEFDVMGLDHKYGEAFEGLADLRDALTADPADLVPLALEARIAILKESNNALSDERAHQLATDMKWIGKGFNRAITLARGGPRAAQWTDEAELDLELRVAPGLVEIRMEFAEEALRRHRRAAIDEMLALIFTLNSAWQPHAQLAHGLAFPRPDSIHYRRVRPPRLGLRATAALVDVVDPGYSAESLAIAEAKTPPDVQRIERDGLVALRWIDDPTDQTAVATACSRHEQWIVQIVETKIELGWNAQGDLGVPVWRRHPTPEPLTVFDTGRRAGYLFIDVDETGGVDEERWRTAEPVVKTKTLPSHHTLNEVCIVAQDRAAALRIAERARSAGFSRVLYRTDDGELWDPFPPGLWVEAEPE